MHYQSIGISLESKWVGHGSGVLNAACSVKKIMWGGWICLSTELIGNDPCQSSFSYACPGLIFALSCDLNQSTSKQRRLCTRHRLHHVYHRFVCSPTQPSQPADSALCQNYTLVLPRLWVFSVVHAKAYTQSRNSKSLLVFNSR